MWKFFGRCGASIALLALLTACNVSYGYGKTQPIATPLPGLPTTASLVSLSFADTNHGWAAAADCPTHDPSATSYSCRGLLFRTIDGGRTWTSLPRTLLSPRKIQFVDANNGWMIGTIGERCGNNLCPNVVMATTDGGLVWDRTSNVVASLVDLAATSELSTWVLGERCESGPDCQPFIVETESGGQFWVKHDVPLTGQNFRFQRLDGAAAWVTSLAAADPSTARLAFTADSGETWKTAPSPCPGRTSGFAFRSATEGWLLCADDAKARAEQLSLYTTSDGAKSWQQAGTIDVDAPVATVREGALDGLVGGLARPAGGGEWLALRMGTLETTSDGGKTWRSALSAGEALGPVQFVDSSNGWVVGTRHVWRTVNGGQTWEKRSLDRSSG